MALQTSGTLSLLDVVAEFGGSAPHALSEYYGASDGIPTSGVLRLGDFYGASNIVFPTAGWSGNSTIVDYKLYGLVVSGNNYRYIHNGMYGTWRTVNSNGTFSGNSYVSEGGNTFGIMVSGNKLGYYAKSASSTWVTFTVGSGFSGTSTVTCSSGYGTITTGFNTSGGNIRFVSLNGTTGSWVSLT